MNASIQETCLSLLLAAVAAGLAVTAMGIPGSAHGSIAPSTFPTVIAWLIAALSVLNALVTLRRASGEGQMKAMSARGVGNIVAFLAVSTAYVWLIGQAGFVVATLAYLLIMPVFVCVVSPRHRVRLSRVSFWATLVVFAAIATGAIYGVFVELLNVRF
ncbi:tripartite tricarboxylate transporter TctB family protein [Larsenimonas suaedae]|uniref:Tripartite tricarboxylate transporter TctB family protein n=1 Tax=Larsenimonas suaedae TaxID=1851019 RepID=A0ABU1GTU2_9GAMM|nr:tripartite tricarboxylate transporter TctB family protein [Larsenimonas suaedae]MCM2972208.1 tripartite tricarboxylate transporter TctB family protein [Larsenimonas suaedae]MDR5894996.1 tripartite tricarboxylate transporter TctB family protein [Larsenimonas suaedae]